MFGTSSTRCTVPASPLLHSQFSLDLVAYQAVEGTAVAMSKLKVCEKTFDGGVYLLMCLLAKYMPRCLWVCGKANISRVLIERLLITSHFGPMGL